MESSRNGSAAAAASLLDAITRRASSSSADKEEGSARLYVIILISFYGIFLIAIMIGYLRSKQRDKRRTNVFTRLLHEEEQREWGASLKKHSSCASLTIIPAVSSLRSAAHVPLLPAGLHENKVVLSPLACALCSSVEQSSVSSLCSSVVDARLALEEERDSGTGEGPEDPVVKGCLDNNSDGSSAENLKESS